MWIGKRSIACDSRMPDLARDSVAIC